MSFHADGDHLHISLALNSLDQIFDLRDPVPFRERDLDEDFARYLQIAMKECRWAKQVSIHIRISSTATAHFTADDLKEAVRAYFEFEVESVTSEIRMMMSEARIALALGLTFLVACMAAASLVPNQGAVWMKALEQGLYVTGWVALWRPLNMLLYDWWPLARKRRRLRRIANAAVLVERT